MTADLYAYSGRTTQSEVKEHQIGLGLLNQSPIGGFVLCGTDDLGFRDFVTEDSFCALQFQGYVFDNDDFEWIHDGLMVL